jgi:hypothetical protein
MKKILGWALIVIGLVSIWGSWSYGYGIEAQITMAVVAAVGLWLVLKNKSASTPTPPTPPTPPTQ